MNIYNILHLSLYQIQLFLSAAAYQNFSKAADSLHVTQSMLSKNIKAMEDMLGLDLFIRYKGTVKLTTAGEFLQKEFRAVYSSVENAIKKAQQIQNGQIPPLVVGVPDSVDSGTNSYIRQTIAYFKKNHDHTVLLELMPFQDLKNKLLLKQLDIVFTFLFEEENYRDSQLSCQPVLDCPFQVFMHKNNVLAKQKKVKPMDLKEQSFIVLSPLQAPSYVKMIKEICGGFEPKISKYLSASGSMTSNVEGESEIFIADRFINNTNRNIVGTELDVTLRSGVLMAWNQGNASPIIHQFLAATKELWQGKQMATGYSQ